jgi:hypothetical protein
MSVHSDLSGSATTRPASKLDARRPPNLALSSRQKRKRSGGNFVIRHSSFLVQYSMFDPCSIFAIPFSCSIFDIHKRLVFSSLK